MVAPSALIAGFHIGADEVVIEPGPALMAGGWCHEPLRMAVAGCDLRTVPERILQIPAIFNLAPVVWASGLTLHLASADARLLASLAALREVLRTMHPGLAWSGSVVVDEVLEPMAADGGRTALLFSGGLDSVVSAEGQRGQALDLVTVRGADVALDDDEGWSAVSAATAAAATSLAARPWLVSANIKDFLNYERLEALCPGIPSWWLKVQYGPGLAALMAVPAWCSGAGRGMIAASYSPSTLPSGGNGSLPEVDEAVAWEGLSMVHDGFALGRQDKIRVLVERAAAGHETLPLRVCYAVRGGGNCGRCEKCCRTLFGLLVAGADPRAHGFACDGDEAAANIAALMARPDFAVSDITGVLWAELRAAMHLPVLGPLPPSPAVQGLMATLEGMDLEGRMREHQRRWQRRQVWKAVLARCPGVLPAARWLYHRVHG